MAANPLALRADGAIFSDVAWEAIAGRLRLPRRELAIVRCLFDGGKQVGIAADLRISPHTVSTHLERLHRKLGVQDRATLVVNIVRTFLQLTGSPPGLLPPVCARRTWPLPVWAPAKRDSAPKEQGRRRSGFRGRRNQVSRRAAPR